MFNISTISFLADIDFVIFTYVPQTLNFLKHCFSEVYMKMQKSGTVISYINLL